MIKGASQIILNTNVLLNSLALKQAKVSFSVETLITTDDELFNT